MQNRGDIILKSKFLPRKPYIILRSEVEFAFISFHPFLQKGLSRKQRVAWQRCQLISELWEKGFGSYKRTRRGHTYKQKLPSDELSHHILNQSPVKLIIG